MAYIRLTMNRNCTLGLAIAAFALVISACSSNVSVVKRQYNKGWNLSLAGGKNSQFVRPTRLERIAQTKIQSKTILEQVPLELAESDPSISDSAVKAKASATQVLSSVANAAAHKAHKALTQTVNKAVAKAKASSSAPAEKKGSASTSDSYYSKSSALVLMFLGIAILGFALHRFYLGYPLEGTLMSLLIPLAIVFVWYGMWGSSLFFVLALIIALIYLIWWIWDLVCILNGNLGPRDGSGFKGEI